MGGRDDEPTMTAWWMQQAASASCSDDATVIAPSAAEPPFADIEDDALDALLAQYAGGYEPREDGASDLENSETIPAPASIATLAAPASSALAAPRTPIEMWALLGEEPPPPSRREDPHATEDGTVFLVAPAPWRPETIVPPARAQVAPMMHPPAPTPPFVWRTAPMIRPTPWRARAVLASIGAIAFGAALLVGLWYGGTIAAAPTPPEPLFPAAADTPPPAKQAALSDGVDKL